MKRTLVGAGLAAVFAGVLAVPPAFAAHSTPSPAAKRPAATAAGTSSTHSTATTSTSRAQPNCSYPNSRNTTLTLRPTYAKFRHPANVNFHGYLRSNGCPLKNKRIELHRKNPPKVAGYSFTNKAGFYSITIRVKRTNTFFATFGGTANKNPARSNNSHIVIGP